jgi:hypothetical protein
MKDPPRLTDPTSKAFPELRGLIRACQRDVPSRARLQALGDRLAPIFGVAVQGAAATGGALATGTAATSGTVAKAGSTVSGSAAPGAATATTSTSAATGSTAATAAGAVKATTGLATVMKIGVSACVAVGLATGALVHAYRPAVPSPAPASPASIVAPARPPASAPVSATASPTASVSEAATANATTSLPGSASEFAPASTRGAAAALASASTHTAGSVHPPTAAPAAAAAAAAALSNSETALASPGSNAVDASALHGSDSETESETELGLLQRAADQLRVDPARALATAERHAARFPSGALAQEREVIVIEALVLLHRDGEANEHASRFFRVHPASAHAPRILALLGRDADASAHPATNAAEPKADSIHRP